MDKLFNLFALRFNLKKISLLPAILSLALSVQSAAAQSAAVNAPVAPIKISAHIDTTTVTMGERTTLHVEVVKNGHVGTILAPFSEPDGKTGQMSIAGIEIRQVEVDSANLGNDRIQVVYDILLQPFEPKDYAIPAFKYALDKDTFTSNVIALKVIEPEIPQEMRDSLYINPLRPPMSIKAEWYDWVPNWFSDYWYFWVAGLALIALAIAVFILYKKNGKSLLPVRKIVPPYELAMRRLSELKRKRLHEQGHNKAYYTELTDILRQYLGGRFRIFALEMTSSQILDELAKNKETAPFAKELKPMFTVADFVKFAKQDSTPDENIRSYNAVERFIEQTKPEEKPATEQKSDSAKTKA